MAVQFSSEADREGVEAGLKALTENAWELDNEKIGIRKTYYFKTYTKCLVGTHADNSTRLIFRRISSR